MFQQQTQGRHFLFPVFCFVVFFKSAQFFLNFPLRGHEREILSGLGCELQVNLCHSHMSPWTHLRSLSSRTSVCASARRAQANAFVVSCTLRLCHPPAWHTFRCWIKKAQIYIAGREFLHFDGGRQKLKSAINLLRRREAFPKFIGITGKTMLLRAGCKLFAARYNVPLPACWRKCGSVTFAPRSGRKSYSRIRSWL